MTVLRSPVIDDVGLHSDRNHRATPMLIARQVIEAGVKTIGFLPLS